MTRLRFTLGEFLFSSQNSIKHLCRESQKSVRAVRRYENLGGHLVMWRAYYAPLVEIWLSEQPKNGGHVPPPPDHPGSYGPVYSLGGTVSRVTINLLLQTTKLLLSNTRKYSDLRYFLIPTSLNIFNFQSQVS